MKGTFVKYTKILWLMSINSLFSAISVKSVFLIFVIGKIFRFSVYISFLYFLVQGVNTLADYNANQTLFVFLTFSVVDILGQTLYRQVYSFKPLIISGDFDLILVKPMSSLFRGLVGSVDFNDMVLIPVLIAFTYFVGQKLDPNFINVVQYFLLIINALMISTAFHILILALYVRYLTVDYLTLLYRDLVSLGRLPVEIYREPIRWILTFVVPVATMVTVPARALMGLLTWQGLGIALCVGILGVVGSLYYWKYALKFYTSASS
jgi:ABC-2 type transport system permease protein